MHILQDLNAEQRRAVESMEGQVVIIAGPGTGKTKTLTTKIAYLLEQSVPAEQILALTFTRKAAQEMEQRLEGSAKGKLPLVTTFHGLGYKLLNGSSKLSIISELERLAIIKSLAKLEKVSVRELSLKLSSAKTSFRKFSLLKAYNQALQELGMIDYDDLLVQTHDWLKQNPAKNWTYVLVDEFQDTNQLQYEIIKLLGYENITIIGDPHQSIYAFRGANALVFDQFKADFPKAREITLTHNYRSTPAILSVCGKVFPGRELTATVSEPGSVQVVETLNEYTEADWIIKDIAERLGGVDMLSGGQAVDNATHFKDHAVLYRTRRAAQILQQRFAASGIPYQIAGDDSPLNSKLAHLIIDLLQQAKGDVTPSHYIEQHSNKLGLRKKLEINKTLQLEFAYIVNLLARFETIKPCLEYLDRLQNSEFYDERADCVVLSTIHAAKGLEFSYVYICGCEEGILPSGEDLDEERRLLYVAMTRAKHQLTLLHTRERAKAPSTKSRFINDLTCNDLANVLDPAIETTLQKRAKWAAKHRQTSLF